MNKSTKSRSQKRTVLIVGEGADEQAFLNYLKGQLLEPGAGLSIKILNAKGKGAKRVIEWTIRQAAVAGYDQVAAFLDEPQKMEGTKTLESLKRFNPLMILRYSATHKTEHNKRVLRKLVKGDNLFNLSGGLDQYQGFVVADINANTDTISFTNGVELRVGEATGDVNEVTLRRIQIREAIKVHFEKEQALFHQGIKRQKSIRSMRILRKKNLKRFGTVSITRPPMRSILQHRSWLRNVCWRWIKNSESIHCYTPLLRVRKQMM